LPLFDEIADERTNFFERPHVVDGSSLNRRTRHTEVPRRFLVLRDDDTAAFLDGLDAVRCVAAISGQHDGNGSATEIAASGFKERIGARQHAADARAIAQLEKAPGSMLT